MIRAPDALIADLTAVKNQRSPPGTAGSQVADKCGPVVHGASHRHAMDKVASNFGSKFGSLTIISRGAACVWPA